MPEHQFIKRVKHVCPRWGAQYDGPRGRYDLSEHIEPARCLDFDDGPDQRNWLFG